MAFYGRSDSSFSNAMITFVFLWLYSTWVTPFLETFIEVEMAFIFIPGSIIYAFIHLVFKYTLGV
jgi:hypothetical protein